ncbi:MAG: hypothetical protein ACI8VW_002773 [bacterium]|jgi:hypothetical protein
MWKTLVLLVVVGILVWLGYMEDQNTQIDLGTMTQLESSSVELASEGLSEQVDDATDAAAEKLSDASDALSEVDAPVIDEIEQMTETTTDALENSVESIEDDIGSVVATAAEQIAPPMSLSGLSRKIGGAIGTTTSLLASVSDEASAKAVLPKLTSVSEGLSDVALGVPEIPDAAKAALAKLISSGIDRIKPLADKALSIPGVGDVLQPTLDPMLETFKGLTQ